MRNLPIVRPEIGYSLEQELFVDDDQYIENELERLSEENPSISYFISKFAQLSDDKDNVAFCGLMVYRMLESQSEADWLKEQIGE